MSKKEPGKKASDQTQGSQQAAHYGRLGFTTGACAAAAAKAALQGLIDAEAAPESVTIPFPGKKRHTLPVAFVKSKRTGVEAAVYKDAGDDPDITDGALVSAFVEWSGTGKTVFTAGEGVGTVTKKGLSVPPGEPAINPVPRKMIRAALQELSGRPVQVTLSIAGGCEMARKTYNPRLGIVGGLSILGTTGRVRPFSCQALKCSLVCELDVAGASGVIAPVLVPGHIGESSARRQLPVSAEQVIEVGNEWGFVLERLARYPFSQALLWGHPGKLAKLAAKEWNTHSSCSRPAIETVRRLGKTLLGLDLTGYTTTEGIFAALEQDEQQRLAEAVGAAIASAVKEKTGRTLKLAVVLVNMAGDLLGAYGDLSTWR